MICYEARALLLWLIVFLSTFFGNVSANDPCFNYTLLNDTTYTTINTGAGNSGFSAKGWHRVTSSTEGLLVRTCPTGNECGTASQVWMNDTIPAYSAGETQVKLCIKGGNNCCDRSRQVWMKNCNTFVVYELITLPSSSGYCFEVSSSVLVPVSTTSTSPKTTTTQSTTKQPLTLTPVAESTNQKPDDKKSNVAVIAGVTTSVGIVLIAGSVLGIRVVNRKCLRIEDGNEKSVDEAITPQDERPCTSSRNNLLID